MTELFSSDPETHKSTVKIPGPTAGEAAAILFYFQRAQDIRVHVRNTGERTLGMSSVVEGRPQRGEQPRMRRRADQKGHQTVPLPLHRLSARPEQVCLVESARKRDSYKHISN